MRDSILVTGSTGFIGRYVVRSLLEGGYNVIEYRREQGDLAKSEMTCELNGVSCIVHLASRTYVPDSWKCPEEYIRDNVAMLTNVLRHCRTKNSKLIFLSTYLYGTPERIPINEDHPINPFTPYHVSKKICEDICRFYSCNYDMDITVLRPFNVYGHGQSKDFLISKIIEQVMDESREYIEVYDLKPKRDYVYVADVADIITDLVPYVKGYNVYNIGSGISYSVSDIIDISQEVFGTHKDVREVGIERKNEVMDCVADISRIRTILPGVKMTDIRRGILCWKKAIYDRLY